MQKAKLGGLTIVNGAAWQRPSHEIIASCAPIDRIVNRRGPRAVEKLGSRVSNAPLIAVSIVKPSSKTTAGRPTPDLAEGSGEMEATN